MQQKLLEIVGDHAYAYSGVVSLNNESKTGLKFTSGNYLFVGNFNWTWDYHSILEAEDYGITIKFNDGNIFFSDQTMRASSGRAGTNAAETIEIIIPAYTEVEILGSTEANTNYSLLLTGRIYRTRD